MVRNESICSATITGAAATYTGAQWLAAAGAVVRNGAGDYSITLTRAFPSATCQFACSVIAAAAGPVYSIEHVSDTEKRVRWTGGADVDFHFLGWILATGAL